MRRAHRATRRPRNVRHAPRERAHAGAGWEPVADWYSGHLREEGTLLRAVVYPNVLRMLGAVRGKRILDVACGEGTFAGMLTDRGAHVLGVDASPALITVAKRRQRGQFSVGDARRLDAMPSIARGMCDAAVCLLAIANMDPMESVFHGVANCLQPGAPFLLVLAHPCFRIPRQSGWGWDEQRSNQYRRVDRYLTPLAIPIQAHPGSAPSVMTRTYHRPLSMYVAALADAGFAITALEEWTSDRTSDSGPRVRAENRSRREIPVFLALRAVRV